MIRALFVMLVAAACGGQAGPSSGAAPGGPPTSKDDPGAPTPNAAVSSFMAAIKAQDLDAIAVIWGTDKGPARDVVPADQLRKRELIMECYFQHDNYQVKSDVESSANLHAVVISVTKGAITRESKMQVVKGPHDRWYVNNMSLEPLQDICSGQNTAK